MADILFDKLVRDFKEGTPFDQSSILIDAYQHLFKEQIKINSEYNRFWDWISKTAVKDYNQPLVMSKFGLACMTFPTMIEQGESFAPTRHPNCRMTYWTAFNPMEIEVKFSTHTRDQSLFSTPHNFAVFMENQAHAYTKTEDKFKQALITLLFVDSDEFKKVGSLKGDGKDGINLEIAEMLFPADVATKGHKAYEVDLSLEKKFYCYKDGKPTRCCDKTVTDAKPYQVTTNRFKEITDALRKCLAAGKTTCKKANLKGFGNANFSEDYAKLIGLVQDVKEAIVEIKTTETSKYIVGIDHTATDKNCCKGNEDCKKLLKKGINLGCCSKCTEEGENKCCCYNQDIVEGSDLGIAINPFTLLEIEKGFALLNHPGYFENITSYLGVSEKFLYPFIKKGTLVLMNRKTLGAHAIGSEIFTVNNVEMRVITSVFNRRFHLVKWPFQWHTFEQAS